jgi:hypothetical protein
MRHQFIIAYGPWKWFLKAAGFRAITMPWRSIYVLEAHVEHERLRRYELVHIAQIERCGAARFSVLYAYCIVRHGYWKHPPEREARGSAVGGEREP